VFEQIATLIRWKPLNIKRLDDFYGYSYWNTARDEQAKTPKPEIKDENRDRFASLGIMAPEVRILTFFLGIALHAKDGYPERMGVSWLSSSTR